MRVRNERLLWLLVALAGAWGVWFGTAEGVGVSRDSITYLRGAEHIGHGDGYVGVGDTGRFGPVDHWPPLYSMTIALPVAAGLSVTQAARLVNALALFALLIVTALLVRRLAPDAALAPLIAMIAVLVAPTILRNHLMAWSESIFLPLVLTGFLKVHDYLARDRVGDLAAAATCFGLAAVDRYSGVAFIAALTVVLALRDVAAGGRRRFVRPLTFVVVAGIPTAVWVVRNMLVASRAHDRPFSPHMPSMNHVRALLDSLSLWLLPQPVPFRARVLALLVVTTLAVLLARRHRARPGSFWTVTGLCAAAYLGFVLVTISFFDFDVNYDTRMMSPILVLVVVYLATVGRRAFARPMAAPAKLLVVLFGAALVLLAGYSVTLVRAGHDEPAQFASDRWTHARAWELVASVPSDVPVYASSPYVTAYFVDREVLPLPETPPGGAGFLLFYPNVDGAGATLDPAARSLLNASAVDSTETVILYRIER
ncbi:MAG TPA: hypothetical protein VEC56_00275 [Candidatus Krumholzibacteria bacterium]|nr:hypothetical protein [Candidatus Krumholzibacteria bacterium]